MTNLFVKSAPAQRIQTKHTVVHVSLLLFLGTSLIYLAFLKPGIWGFDGSDMLNMAKSLVLEGDFSIPKGAGAVLGRDGQYYSIRYPLLPVISTPFVAVGLWLGHALNLPTHYTAAVCALIVSILLTAWSTVAVYLLALRLGSSAVGAYSAALCFAFGTVALVYGHQFFAEPLLAALTVTAVLLAFQASPSAWGVGGLTMLSIMAKPAGIVIGPVLAGYFLLKRYSLKRVALPLLGTAMGVLLYMAYNYLRFGSIFSAGQSTSRFTLEGFIPRLVGLLLSPGAGGGLFWYCPVTLLAGVGLWKLAKGDRLAEALAVLGMFSSYWILYSFWQFGGWSWGPRFLVPTLPLLLAPTALLDARGRRWLLALAAVGFLVNVPTLLTFYQRYYAEASDAGKLVQALALWGNGLDAPLFNIWGAALRQLDVALSVDVRSVLNSAGTPPAAGNLLSADLMQVMAVWWWFLPAVGMPLWLGIVAALGLIAGGVSCLWGWAQQSRRL